MRTASLFLVALTAAAALPPTLQFSAHNVAPGSGIRNKLIAADSTGNLFVISTLSSDDSKTTIHITKTDRAGKTLATFDFGGSGNTTPAAATVDPSGNLFIGGTSNSVDFPLVSPLQSAGLGFLAKLDAGLTKVLYSTRLPTPPPYDGTGYNSLTAITLDKAGNIYFTGGNGLLVLQGFVAELSPDGQQLLFFTYYTGSSTVRIICGPFAIGGCPAAPQTYPTAIAVAADGSIVIAGETNDSIPVTAGAFAQQCGCGGGAFAGFVAKLAPGGTAVRWGTYIPLSDPVAYAAESSYQQGVGIRNLSLDSSGNIYLSGYAPRSFPTTPDALQPSFPAAASATDAVIVSPQAGFIAMLDSTGSRLLHSTYFGGRVRASSPPLYAGVTGLATDTDGSLWITGVSATSALPNTSQPLLGQAYVASLSSDLSSVRALYTTPDGGSGIGLALTKAGIAAAGTGNSLLIGQPGTGPSILGVSPTFAYTTADITAPYQLVTVYGIGIGPAVARGAEISPPNNTISRTLGGVQVLFDGSPAALLYAGPNQINAIVPRDTRTGRAATVQVVTPSGTIDGPGLFVQFLSPQLIADPGGFAVPAVNQDGTINSAANPAPLGSVVAVWLSGIGNSVAADNVINFAQSSNYGIAVFGPSGSGGLTSLEVRYAGSAPQQPSGISQINFVLPRQKYNGFNYMPFQVQATVLSGGLLQPVVAVSSQFLIYVK